MIDVSVVLNRIQTSCPTYVARLAKQDDMQWPSEVDKVYISIGYGSISSSHPEKLQALPQFNLQGEDNIQVFRIKTACDVSRFREVWINIFKSLQGWNPNEGESSHTSFNYAHGVDIGITNGFLWFDHLWLIGFPTNTILQV